MGFNLILINIVLESENNFFPSIHITLVFKICFSSTYSLAFKYYYDQKRKSFNITSLLEAKDQARSNMLVNIF